MFYFIDLRLIVIRESVDQEILFHEDIRVQVEVAVNYFLLMKYLTEIVNVGNEIFNTR